MDIASVEWLNMERTSLKAFIDGEMWYVPADPDNRHYKEILVWSKTNSIVDYVPTFVEVIETKPDKPKKP